MEVDSLCEVESLGSVRFRLKQRHSQIAEFRAVRHRHIHHIGVGLLLDALAPDKAAGQFVPELRPMRAIRRVISRMPARSSRFSATAIVCTQKPVCFWICL
jgi:predicted dienelactone hydrolase